jgi:hypothetical protein
MLQKCLANALNPLYLRFSPVDLLLQRCSLRGRTGSPARLIMREFLLRDQGWGMFAHGFDSESTRVKKHSELEAVPCYCGLYISIQNHAEGSYGYFQGLPGWWGGLSSSSPSLAAEVDALVTSLISVWDKITYVYYKEDAKWRRYAVQW